MVKLAIVGGALQGMELAYLSRKAGYETVVIDKDFDAPALSLGDHMEVFDPLMEPHTLMELISDCDAVIPANENLMLLNSLVGLARAAEVPLLFDIDAYRVTSSKLKTNELIAKLGIEKPNEWPQCGFPAVVKPSSTSGSKGVRVVSSSDEMREAVSMIVDMGQEPVVQSYVSGMNVSLEVIGDGESYRPFTTTEILLDDRYDCKGVLCSPHILPEDSDSLLQEYSLMIAEGLQLQGLMDVEAVMDGVVPRLLEVDARFPSQTPAAIYHATGVNLLQELYSTFVEDRSPVRAETGFSLYEHLTYVNGVLKSCGEKRFAAIRSPDIIPGFYGCDEAITDHRPDSKRWSAAIMISGESGEEVLRRRNECINRMMEDNNISIYIDPEPEAVL